MFLYCDFFSNTLQGKGPPEAKEPYYTHTACIYLVHRHAHRNKFSIEMSWARVHQINLWSSLPNLYYYYVHITYTKLVHKYNSITQLAFFKLERHNALPVTFQVAHNLKKNTMWHFWKIHWKKIQDECYLFDQVVSPCQTYLKTDMNYYFVQDIENVYFKHRIL